MNAWLWVAAIVVSTTAADVLQSLEMRRQGKIESFGPKGLIELVRRILRRPLLLISIACMAISFVSFMALLSVADLSFAVPATAASYLVETALARWLLREQLGKRRWAGAFLVAAGVALLAL